MDNEIETCTCIENEMVYNVDWRSLLTPITISDNYENNNSYTLENTYYYFQMNGLSGSIYISSATQNFYLTYEKCNSSKISYKLYLYEIKNETLFYQDGNIYYAMSKEIDIVKVAILNKESKQYTWACEILNNIAYKVTLFKNN